MELIYHFVNILYTITTLICIICYIYKTFHERSNGPNPTNLILIFLGGCILPQNHSLFFQIFPQIYILLKNKEQKNPLRHDSKFWIFSRFLWKMICVKILEWDLDSNLYTFIFFCQISNYILYNNKTNTF